MIPSMGDLGERQLIRRGAKFDFELVRVRLENGETLEREVVRHPGAVVIVPVLADSRLVMIRNFRIALGEWVWEFPAGTLERDEPPEVCAGRELIEETGYEAGRIVPLGPFYTTPGLTDERMHAFYADGLSHVGQRLEADERIQVRPVSITEAFAMIDRADLVDAKSMLALLLTQRRGLLPTVQEPA